MPLSREDPAAFVIGVGKPRCTIQFASIEPEGFVEFPLDKFFGCRVAANGVGRLPHGTSRNASAPQRTVIVPSCSNGTTRLLCAYIFPAIIIVANRIKVRIFFIVVYGFNE